MHPFHPDPGWYEKYWYAEEPPKRRSRFAAFIASLAESSFVRAWSEQRAALRAGDAHPRQFSYRKSW